MVNPNKTYGLTNPLQDTNPLTIITNRAPTTLDRKAVGTLWIDQTTNQSWMMTSAAAGAATFILLGPGASDVDTLTGDGGGAISPVAGNITLAGGTNITTAGAGNTITYNLDPAIVLATSVTSPLYTSGAAADVAITAPAGQDIVLTLGDAAGADNFIINDSGAAPIFTIDSNGVVGALAGLTVTGAFTQTAGIVNIGADAAANAINLGTGAAAKVVTIGSVTGAASLDLLAGTGNFTLEGNVATTYAISNVGVNTGQVDIAGGTGARTINIGQGGTGAKTLNICTAGSVDVISVGSATAGAITVDTAAGISLDAATASNFTVTGAAVDLTLASVGGSVAIDGSEALATAINLDASDAAGGITMSAGTGGILIGDQADCTTIDVGNFAPTANRTITVGGGTVITAATTDTIDIGVDGATTNANSIKTVNVNTGGVTLGEVLTNIASGAVTSGTHTTSIATGNRAAGTMVLNMMTGTGTKVLNIGNVDGITQTNIDGAVVINENVNAAFTAQTGTATGAITLGNIANSGAVAIQSSLTVDIDAAGALSLNSTGAALNLGNDANNFAVNIGTAGTRTITIGSATGTLALDSSGGDMTVTGIIKQIDAELIGTTGIYIPAINQNAMVNTAANTGGVATGATGDINNVMLQTGVNMNAFVIGAAQTILQPIMGANGLIISGDQTVAEGYELNLPYHQYTVGTSAAFFFELGLYINDMDGSIPYVFGFRKTEANNAVFANYTDYATIGMISGSSATNIVVATELNSAGQTVTDSGTAWGGDGSTNTLTVYVSAAGVVSYDINGTPYAGPGFTFDGTDVLIPFIRVEHTATPTEVSITSMRIGFQA